MKKITLALLSLLLTFVLTGCGGASPSPDSADFEAFSGDANSDVTSEKICAEISSAQQSEQTLSNFETIQQDGKVYECATSYLQSGKKAATILVDFDGTTGGISIDGYPVPTFFQEYVKSALRALGFSEEEIVDTVEKTVQMPESGTYTLFDINGYRILNFMDINGGNLRTSWMLSYSKNMEGYKEGQFLKETIE